MPASRLALVVPRSRTLSWTSFNVPGMAHLPVTVTPGRAHSVAVGFYGSSKHLRPSLAPQLATSGECDTQRQPRVHSTAEIRNDLLIFEILVIMFSEAERARRD